mgnify:CR=1 FL=1
MYAKIQDTTILETGRRPEWRYPADHDTNPGEIITDDSIYRAGGIDPEPDAPGWHEVSDENKPSHDPATEKSPQPKPQSEWQIKSDRVVRTWNAPIAKTVAERQNQLSSQAQSQFNATLQQGFTDSDGVRWQAISVARDKILDLTQRIQEFRAGNVTSALPQSKTSVKLTDATGAPQDVGETKILQLAELGSDFKDAAEDRLEQLIGQIMAAQSQGDLDVIDVTTGWPT